MLEALNGTKFFQRCFVSGMALKGYFKANIEGRFVFHAVLLLISS